MSWLYSVIFAGLMASAGSEVPSFNIQEIQREVGIEAVSQQDVTEKFEQTYPISPNGRINVSNINGSIVVEASDTNEVRLEATKIADSAETLASVEIKVDSRADSFSVEAEYKNWKYGDRSETNRSRRIQVQFRLVVPRTAELREIETVNGSVKVSNFVNFTKVSAVNGEVSATNLSGAADLSTVNGTVVAEFDRVDRGARIALNTVNGRVNLTLPSDVDATLKADTLNGAITNDFGLPVRKGKYVGRSLYGKIGSGETRVSVESVNGPLSIMRRKDGRNQNPVINLLPAAGDIDEEASVRREVNRERMNADRMKRAEQRVEAAAERAAAEAKKRAVVVNGATLVIDAEELARTVKEAVTFEADAFSDFANFTWSGALPNVKRLTKTISSSAEPNVRINSSDCIVTVRAWDKPEVKYVMTEMSGRPGTDGAAVEETGSGSDIALTVRGDTILSGGLMPGQGSQRMDVYVPRNAKVVIETDSPVQVSGLGGAVEINGKDGAVSLRNVSGRVKLVLADNNARLIGVNADLDITLNDAEALVEGELKSLKATVADSCLTLTLPNNANARLVSNEPINIERADAVKDGENSFRLGNGGPSYTFELREGRVTVKDTRGIDVY